MSMHGALIAAGVAGLLTYFLAGQNFTSSLIVAAGTGAAIYFLDG